MLKFLHFSSTIINMYCFSNNLKSPNFVLINNPALAKPYYLKSECKTCFIMVLCTGQCKHFASLIDEEV